MLDFSFQGPDWLTGGVLGTQASLLVYPAVVLVWLYVVLRNRHTKLRRPAVES